MGKIKHRLPVIDGKTDKEKISQLGDSLFQLIRELNLEDEKTADIVLTEQGGDNRTLGKVNEIGEKIDSVKAEIEGSVESIEALQETCTQLTKANEELETGLETATGDIDRLFENVGVIGDRPYILASGTADNGYGALWKYALWSNGDVEFWRVITLSFEPQQKSMVIYSGTDGYYPKLTLNNKVLSFEIPPALSVSAYALNRDVTTNIELYGLSESNAKTQVPKMFVYSTEWNEYGYSSTETVPGFIVSVYARGRVS